jgi:uncharacterized protein
MAVKEERMKIRKDMSVWYGLLEVLRDLGPFTLAYSGGLDSRFLAHAARSATVPLSLVHVRGPHVAPVESEYALAWAKSAGLSVNVLSLDPLSLQAVAGGTTERCYACKRLLFGHILAVAEGPVCDGSNASDAGKFRPGKRALLEYGVRSPLAEAGLTKDMIRALARRTGLSRPDQQARACLLTRLPYGRRPDARLLARLAEGERVVEEALAAAGYEDFPFRLRFCDTNRHELHLGREVHSMPLLEELERALFAAGFPCIRVLHMRDLSGYFDRTNAGPET